MRRILLLTALFLVAPSASAVAQDARPRDSQGWVLCNTATGSATSTFSPLSDSAAAALVVGMTENRGSTNANASSTVGDANHYRPSAGEIFTFLNSERSLNGELPAESNPYAAFVTGGFTGSTDEIIQWGAAKWGIPVDWLRAQYTLESNWEQTAMGDRLTVADVTRYPEFSRASSTEVFQSLGITQVRWSYPDQQTSGMGTEPLRWKSTAFNVDYQASAVRFYFDDPQGKRTSWGDGTYSRCNHWLSIGGWFNPYPWNNSGQQSYVSAVQSRLSARTWEQASFPPATPTGTEPPPPTSGQVVKRISAGSDDAEQAQSGPVNLTSSDIELVFEPPESGTGATQTVGLRFTGLAIPQAATITSAFVQFVVDEATSGATNLTFRGQAAGNAATFATSTGNVSGRPVTAASVAWAPASWTTIGAAGDAQKTPDLKTVIQEIVNRSDWASGNALALIVTGSGSRVAEAFESGSAVAALLTVNFTTGSPPSDTTSPSVPAGLTATPASSSQINLAWGSSTDNVGVTGYRVYRDNVQIAAVVGTTYANTGLQPSTTYSYQVSAIDAAGNESARSTAVQATTQAEEPPPPTDVIPPTVTIVEPADGSSVRRKDRTLIVINADDAESGIDVVDLYIEGQFVTQFVGGGTHTYRLRFGGTPNRTALIEAEAFDRSGNSATATVHVFVLG